MNADFSFPHPVFKPPLTAWPDAGVYHLWVRVMTARRLRVGRLGRFLFPAGLYVYTGRAARALPSRIARHARGAGVKHWHIDYLLANQAVRLEKIVLVSLDPAAECPLNQSVGEGAACPVPGFGSSDCRAGCKAHLWLLLARARLKKA
jgi:Uri superfamily endonuclease